MKIITYHASRNYSMLLSSAEIAAKKIKIKCPFIQNIKPVFYERKNKTAFDFPKDYYIVQGEINEKDFEEKNVCVGYFGCGVRGIDQK